MWDGVAGAIVEHQLQEDVADFRSSQATSSKNYQWLALSVFRALESGDRRLLRDGFSTWSRSSLASVSPTRADHTEIEPESSLYAHNTLSLRGADSDDEHRLPSRSPARGGFRSPSRSVSPWLHRSTAAATASWELGAQTLADVVRARMKQGLRCWSTYARQHRLQEMHSSVLLALHKSVQDVAAPSPALAPTVVPLASPAQASARSTNSRRGSQASTYMNSHHGFHASTHVQPSSALPQVSARSSHSNRSSLVVDHAQAGHVVHQPEERHLVKEPGERLKQELHAAHSEPQLAPMQQKRPSVKVQAGAKMAGRKYCSHSLRLRSRERHVRVKERIHGPHHPEVEHALLQLAKHHGEFGAVDEQQAALRRALDAHEKHLNEHQHAGSRARATSHEVHELQKRVQELEAAEATTRRLLEESRASTAENLQKRRTAAVIGLLEGPPESMQPPPPGSTDAIVQELYADQARVAEVIKLAGKLWDSGILSVAPRRPPLLKSSLLLRLADRCYHAAMRNALQFWWRRCSLEKAAEEVTQNGGVWPIPVQKQSEMHGHRHTTGGHEHDRVTSANGVWQDPRHAGGSTPRHNTTEASEQDECRRLREELKALQAVVAQQGFNRDGQHNADDVWEENSRLRAELQEMRESFAVQSTHVSSAAAFVVEQPDGLQFPATHENHLTHGTSQVHQSDHSRELGSGGSRRPSVDDHHQASASLVAPASAEESIHRVAPRGHLSLHIGGAVNLKHADMEPSDLFVTARVGNQEFRTEPVTHSGSPVWHTNLQFAVDLTDVNRRVLLLKVMNHDVFESGDCLSSMQVDIMSLRPGISQAMQARSHDDEGAIEIEVCFKPDGGEEGPHHYEDGRGWVGLEDKASPSPLDALCESTPKGILDCRIVAGHHLKNTDTGLLDHGVSDPFVVVRLGNKEFKTKTVNDDLNPVWDAHPFRFEGVDLDDTNLRFLHLKVYNHHVFFANDCIGFTDVLIPTLETGRTVRLKEALQEGDGGELEFEVCFMPEGEHMAPAAAETASRRPSATASDISRDLPLAGELSSRRPSVVSQPAYADLGVSTHRAAPGHPVDLPDGSFGDVSEPLSSVLVAGGPAGEPVAGAEVSSTREQLSRDHVASAISILGDEDDSGEEDGESEAEEMDAEELANMMGM